MSLYWSFSTITTTGYGDVTPDNDLERMVAIVCMLMCALLFGYVVGSLATLVSKINMRSVRGTENIPPRPVRTLVLATIYPLTRPPSLWCLLPARLPVRYAFAMPHTAPTDAKAA